ncbi:MAG: HEAT repeat domain-containing protein [Gemmataceae bacterium]
MKQLSTLFSILVLCGGLTAGEQEYNGKSLNYWLQRLESQDKLVRQNSVHALGKIRSRSPQINEALKKALRDKEPNVRAEAADSLGRRRSGARNCISVLIEVFQQDKDTFVRGAAALAMGQIGGNSQAAAALAKGLKDKSLHIRTHASYALGRMGRSAQTVVPALVEALKDSSVTVRRNAKNALQRIDPAALQRAEKK